MRMKTASSFFIRLHPFALTEEILRASASLPTAMRGIHGSGPDNWMVGQQRKCPKRCRA